MSLQHAAKHLAAHGRGKDTELIHMDKGEIASLQQIAMAHGGSLTINPQITTIGSNIGQKPCFHEFKMSFFLASSRDTYIINDSFAKSEAWNVSPTKGMGIHLPAPFTFFTKKKVKISRATEA